MTLTTNGVLLKRALPELKRLSIDGINVSLDTLKPERFSGIAGLCTDGRETWKQVFEAVKEGAGLGIPMKINCVPIRGLNEDEILDFVALTRELPVDVRFIELMPIGAGKAFRGMTAWSFWKSSGMPGRNFRKRRKNGETGRLSTEGFRDRRAVSALLRRSTENSAVPVTV